MNINPQDQEFLDTYFKNTMSIWDEFFDKQISNADRENQLAWYRSRLLNMRIKYPNLFNKY
jgi:hypothetical protein